MFARGLWRGRLGTVPLRSGLSGSIYRAMRRHASEAEHPASATAAEPGGFRLYVAGQAVSVIGDRVATITFVFLLIGLTHSFPPALALFYLCRVLPTLLGGLLAGVFADHFHRQ